MSRIVVDTNVLVSAILSPDGAAREVLRRCLAGHARPLVGNALFLEYEEVLATEARFTAASITSNDREALLEALLSVCERVDITFLWRPNLPDVSDIHPIELAIAGNAECIVTGNTRDVAAGELVFDSMRVVTPVNWLKEDG